MMGNAGFCPSTVVRSPHGPYMQVVWAWRVLQGSEKASMGILLFKQGCWSGFIGGMNWVHCFYGGV